MIRFKNTEDALQYGAKIKGNHRTVNILQQQRHDLIDRTKELQRQGRIKDALFLASGQCQFTREALEVATGQAINE